MEKVFQEALESIQKKHFNFEEELYQKYLDYFEEFKQKNKLPYHFKEYFTNFYASDRTLYPSIPSKFKISKNTNEIKIDVGILMIDSQGMILAQVC